MKEEKGEIKRKENVKIDWEKKGERKERRKVIWLDRGSKGVKDGWRKERSNGKE